MGAGIRKKQLFKIGAVMLSVLTFCLLAAGCTPVKSFDSELEQIVEPFEFNLAGWELDSLYNETKTAISDKPVDANGGAGTVRKYFDISDCVTRLETDINADKSGGDTGNVTGLEDELGRLRAERLGLEKPAGQILEAQITDTLSGLGIYNPTDIYVNIGITFPPVNFELADPPYLLVISPREKIETRKTVMLLTDLSLAERGKLEAEVDELGVSSIIVKLGGVATYPSFVSNRGDLRWVIDTAVHEWMHQYLTFRPLGFRYLLSLSGIDRDYDVTALDETVADMAGDEIGGMVYDRYYHTSGDAGPENKGEPDFDFNGEMREIRKTVDVLLAGGKVSEAEAFMQERKQYLATQGYYLRKLNQAYFAFYGSYTTSPTSVDPLGDQLRELRSDSRTIKVFLDRASFITSREDLKENLRQATGQPR